MPSEVQILPLASFSKFHAHTGVVVYKPALTTTNMESIHHYDKAPEGISSRIDLSLNISEKNKLAINKYLHNLHFAK